MTDTNLIKHGFKIVIYANHLLRTSYLSMKKTLISILKNGQALKAQKRHDFYKRNYPNDKMIRSNFFFSFLRKNNINFFCGVPDSNSLKANDYYLSKLKKKQKNIITHNEGGSIATAIGYYLSTKKNCSCIFTKFWLREYPKPNCINCR